jgi:subtilase family protein/peptidase inhibitor I9
MRRSFGTVSLGLVVAAAAACTGQSRGSPSGQTGSTAPASSPAVMGDRAMIVLLRDQLTGLDPSRAAAGVRSAAIASSHAPIVAQLQAARPRTVHSFETINGFGATLSPAEVTALQAKPEVLAVVPDRVIQLPIHRGKDAIRPQGAAAATPAEGSTPVLCNTLEPEALQLTNTAFLDPATPQAQEVIDGNGQTVTGRGVTVGILADGLDTTVPGFVHTDGSPVFVDYQDFSGDPAGTPTAGGEMFGDASSIAAQDTPNGRVLNYDISQFGGYTPLPSPCNIRVRGVAPSASLVGLKVYSNLGYTTTSTFVQAIEYAVVHDHVDVLNESFGGNPIADLAQDPISLADAAAVRAGVTVTVSTGDAGPNTIGSPATDPNVIAAGASTQYRLYAQLDLGVASLATGWVDDNVSTFSSGGFAQRRPRTVDVLAPGDLGWALCSTNSALYQDCGNFNEGASPLEIFGGTSEAAPLTAGTAALVIQAYRSTHGGQSPSPALVKSIILSNATDVGAPADEQGAGRINALAAVDAALSVQDQNGAPGPHGTGLLASPNALPLTVNPGETIQRSIQLTNTGTSTIELQPALQQLGPAVAGQTLTEQLDAVAAPTVAPTFVVPAGVAHLDASIAFAPVQSTGQTEVILGLIDPDGRDVAFSYPQGNGSGYGEVEVANPAGGTWTAFIYTVQSGVGAYTGPVQLTWAAENYVPFGSVSPSKVKLPAGSSAWVTATFQAPSQPGDTAAAVRFPGSALAEIPVTLRTLVPIGPRGAAFSGTLTGGNARPYAFPTQTFALDVPPALKDLALSLSVPEAGYTVAGYLIDPNGDVLDSASNIDANGAPQNSLQLFRAAPEAGRWRFVLEELQAAGTQTSVEFSAQIAVDSGGVSAAGLPQSTHTRVSTSTGLPVTVTVTNTGSLTKAYFADARLSSLVNATLPLFACTSATTLPGFCSALEVPTEAAAIEFQAQATVPITMDAISVAGDPDIWAIPVGKDTVAAYLQAPEVPFGWWYMEPALVGPFGAAGAPTEPVTTTVTVAMRAFDPSVTASSGDYWADVVEGTTTYQPLILAPGASGAITLLIKPSAESVGQSVQGTLYVDTENLADEYGTGDEVVGLPYAYTVAP